MKTPENKSAENKSAVNIETKGFMPMDVNGKILSLKSYATKAKAKEMATKILKANAKAEAVKVELQNIETAKAEEAKAEAQLLAALQAAVAHREAIDAKLAERKIEKELKKAAYFADLKQKKEKEKNLKLATAIKFAGAKRILKSL